MCVDKLEYHNCQNIFSFFRSVTYIEEMHHRLDEESISYCQNFFLEIGATAGKL